MDVLYKIFYYSDCLPIFLFLLLKVKHARLGLWAIFLYTLYSVFNNLFNFFLDQNSQVSEFLLFRLFTIIEFCAFSVFFLTELRSTFVRKAIKVLMLLFVLYGIYDYKPSFDSTQTAISAILTIIFSITYFYEQIREPRTLLIYNSSGFWIVVALLIYLSGTFFLFIFSNRYFNDPEFTKIYNAINSSSILLRNILFSIGFLVKDQAGLPLNLYNGYQFDQLFEEKGLVRKT